MNDGQAGWFATLRADCNETARTYVILLYDTSTIHVCRASLGSEWVGEKLAREWFPQAGASAQSTVGAVVSGLAPHSNKVRWPNRRHPGRVSASPTRFTRC